MSDWESDREHLPPMPPGWMPATEADAADIRRSIDTRWLPIIMDLTKLDTAGALGGIRAIITERLRMVHDGSPAGSVRRFMDDAADFVIDRNGDVAAAARAAGLLAAEIDRLASGEQQR